MNHEDFLQALDDFFLDREEWRDIEGYEGYYQVSDFGRVRSVLRKVTVSWRGTTVNRLMQEKILTPKNTWFGYLSVNLSKEGKAKTCLVHVLVCKAFPEICGEWFDGAQCNHKNEVKTDNRVENLEVCTAKYNSNYGTHPDKLRKANTGRTMPQYGVEKAAEKHKKPVASYRNGVLVKRYNSAADAHREDPNLSYVSISAACHGRLDTYRGLEWRFI